MLAVCVCSEFIWILVTEWMMMRFSHVDILRFVQVASKTLPRVHQRIINLNPVKNKPSLFGLIVQLTPKFGRGAGAISQKYGKNNFFIFRKGKLSNTFPEFKKSIYK